MMVIDIPLFVFFHFKYIKNSFKTGAVSQVFVSSSAAYVHET